MQTAVGVDCEVASAPTLCRLEKWADQATAWRLHEVLVDQFIASFKTAPEELVLDFDATDSPHAPCTPWMEPTKWLQQRFWSPTPKL